MFVFVSSKSLHSSLNWQRKERCDGWSKEWEKRRWRRRIRSCVPQTPVGQKTAYSRAKSRSRVFCLWWKSRFGNAICKCPKCWQKNETHWNLLQKNMWGKDTAWGEKDRYMQVQKQMGTDGFKIPYLPTTAAICIRNHIPFCSHNSNMNTRAWYTYFLDKYP